jgi:uncharacterized protein YbbK (DUF523 family)
MIIVSACLAGINCRYNGGNNADPDVRRLVEEGKAIPVCPEQLGGLTTPRLPAEISGGTGTDVLDGNARVILKDGTDVTGNFLNGARETLKIARLAGAQQAIMKSGSPSCGHGKICDGTFSGKKREGNGVTADLLLRNGIKICTENGMKKTPRI